MILARVREKSGVVTVKDHAYTRWGRDRKNLARSSDQSHRVDPELKDNKESDIGKGGQLIGDESDSTNDC